MKTILVTGITGFLGRNFLIQYKEKYNFIGLGNSEKKIAYLLELFPNLKIYKCDISSDNFKDVLENIFNGYKIDYVIHCAAMKHIDICEQNRSLTLKTNVLATEILVNISKKYNVENLIAISTDKAIDPCTTYGMSKTIMERIVLENKYSLFRGVNFFCSDGSVIEKWLYQHMYNNPLTITNLEQTRYYNTIIDICNIINSNIDKKCCIIEPTEVLVVKLSSLLEAFKLIYPSATIKEIGNRAYEKIIETISPNIKVITPSIEYLKNKLEDNLPLGRVSVCNIVSKRN